VNWSGGKLCVTEALGKTKNQKYAEIIGGREVRPLLKFRSYEDQVLIEKRKGGKNPNHQTH